MISTHDFTSLQPIFDVYPKFHEKMSRRYKRMDEYLKKSEHIIFLSSRDEPIENFETFLQNMYKIYNKKMTLINIRNSIIKRKTTKQINDKLQIIEFSFRDKNSKKSWIGNYREWNKIMGLLQLTNSLSEADNKYRRFITN